MWTPKRVLLLAIGYLGFFLGYLAYSQVLGSIDGLPPLPVAFQPRGKDQQVPSPPPTSATRVDEMLQKAFDVGAPELKQPIRVGSSSRGIYLAATKYDFEKDNMTVRVEPVSLAIFAKANPGRYPEINTIRANVAYLTFDRPIKGPKDFDSRKIVKGELHGDGNSQIRIVNNRRTPQKDDDIDILIPKGPVYFDEDQRLISTADTISLTDMQSRPDPIKITASGLEVHLSGHGTPPGQKSSAPGRSSRDSSVERIVLRTNVDMDLYLDSRSNFLVPGREERGPKELNGKTATGPKKTVPPVPKDHVHINTNGPFIYDLKKNLACFEIPFNPNRHFPEQVTVVRHREPIGKDPESAQKNLDPVKVDQLTCEKLELQFRKKNSEAPRVAGADDGSPNLEIETAHATGKAVKLTSEAELLEAHGQDLFHDARTCQTTLKGDPEMWLLKEGNEIHARELEMVYQKGAQQITARGAGRIHLFDKKTGKRTMHARWKEKFSSARDGTYDLLTFSRDAAFVEDEGIDPKDVLRDDRIMRTRTLLRAEELKVWLERQEAGAAPTAGGNANSTTNPKPHQVLATGRVLARSPEMVVHDTENLLIFFKDAPPAALPAGGKPPVTSSLAGGSVRAATKPGEPKAAISLGPPENPPAKPQPDSKPPRPIDLSARFVKAYILRGPTKNELDELRTEGNVRIVQAPNQEDKGVDISGDTLRLIRQPGGNRLDVAGNSIGSPGDPPMDLAQVRLDKLLLLGPEIHIDQATNTAWINGIGAMQMESDTDFQGNKLAQAVPLLVHFNKRMDFDGDSVEFHGGIQAQQGSSHLKCDSLHVYLDRQVSLKEGNKNGQSPRAKKLTCDRNVCVDERVYQPPKSGQLASYRRLDCLELTVNHDDNQVYAPGPGWVRMVQPGNSDLVPAAGGTRTASGAPPGGGPPPSDQWKLTLIHYFKLMSADNKNRTATFWGDGGDVKVLHVPWDKSQATQEINFNNTVDNMPPGGLYLRCDRLTVYSRLDNTRKGQKLDAIGRITVKARDTKGKEFWGNADVVHFDEEKDQVIFEGVEGGKARLFVRDAKGAPPIPVVGKKIIYLRSKGEYIADGVTSIQGSN